MLISRPASSRSVLENTLVTIHNMLSLIFVSRISIGHLNILFSTASELRHFGSIDALLAFTTCLQFYLLKQTQCAIHAKTVDWNNLTLDVLNVNTTTYPRTSKLHFLPQELVKYYEKYQTMMKDHWKNDRPIDLCTFTAIWDTHRIDFLFRS